MSKIGQYYMPCLATEDSTRTEFTPEFYAYSHDMGEGLKLMEHSWIDAALPRTIMSALEGMPRRVVWAGDYADPEPGTVTDENKYGLNLYVLASGDDESVTSVTKLVPHAEAAPRYLINHDQMMYVDIDNCPGHVYYWTQGREYTVHPLPLLTAEGNGRGGGDWRGGQGSEFIGTWARDVISTSDEKPADYLEFRPNFIEGE